mgnify:CR=1 FL=1
MEVFESLKANLVGKNARIVLPEGEEHVFFKLQNAS